MRVFAPPIQQEWNDAWRRGEERGLTLPAIKEKAPGQWIAGAFLESLYRPRAELASTHHQKGGA
jgi:hypothetical protein